MAPCPAGSGSAPASELTPWWVRISVPAAYRDAGGPTAQLWELPGTGHTAGLRTHPAEYERGVTGFFDRALRR